MKHPESLLEATRLFSDSDKAHAYLANLRWPDGVIPCPTCGETAHYYLATQRRWKCRKCKRQFSVKVGTIFESSPITLDKWLIAVWLIVNAKNGISSCELHRSLGITQKSCWHMLHRIRLALQEGTFEKLGGGETEVEIDETYIGGKAVNMHQAKRKERIKSTGMEGKAIVLGFLERSGSVRTYHVPNSSRRELFPRVWANVHHGSQVFTDAHGSYRTLGETYRHGVIDHAVAYVAGRVHTNSLENYWSLLKRTLKGTYVSVEPFHLWRYLDEQSFRYNERKGTDRTRFLSAVSGIAGRRLTYNELTGKVLAAGAPA